MKTKNLLFLTIMFVLLMADTMQAENYPYRSDVLWVTVPDHADWLYQPGEEPKVEVQFYQYGMPKDGTVTYTIGNDLLEDDDKGSVKLKNGRATIKMSTRKTPGFRDLRLQMKIGDTTYKHHVKLGFAPDKIQPFTTLPDDFTSFWDKNLKELKGFPLKYSIEPAPEYTTESVDCSLVKIQINSKGQCVYGYLTKPKNAAKGSCPVVFCPPGAGVKTIKEPLRHKYYAENGFIRLEIEIHGLDPRLSADQFKEINNAFNVGANTYLAQGLDNRDNYYMKHVYLACVRCIDFLTSLPEWDGKNVAVQGGSQGGALAIVTASLDSRVSLCAANHPALSDMAGYSEKGRTGGYPHFHRLNSMLTPEKINTLRYYDVVNFARQMKATTFLTWGYNDDTCPPTTSYAVWNSLRCPKESLITPVNEHWTSEATEESIMKWIKSKLK